MTIRHLAGILRWNRPSSLLTQVADLLCRRVADERPRPGQEEVRPGTRATGPGRQPFHVGRRTCSANPDELLDLGACPPSFLPLTLLVVGVSAYLAYTLFPSVSAAYHANPNVRPAVPHEPLGPSSL